MIERPHPVPHPPRLTRTLVLVGLMGAGKTSVGKRLAALLGVRFIDSDAEIVQAAGMTIPEIFARLGEPAFRDGERRVIARLEHGQKVQRRFVADASHELRSPLATIATGLELLSRGADRVPGDVPLPALRQQGRPHPHRAPAGGPARYRGSNDRQGQPRAARVQP